MMGLFFLSLQEGAQLRDSRVKVTHFVQLKSKAKSGEFDCISIRVQAGNHTQKFLNFPCRLHMIHNRSEHLLAQATTPSVKPADFAQEFYMLCA